MSAYTWLVIAGTLIAVEMMTGTFYLLMLSVAAIIAWLAQHSDASFLLQSIVFLTASALLVGTTYRYRQLKAKTAAYNPADNLDAGAVVTVTHWQNGVGQAHYRGSHWQVVLDLPNEPSSEPIDGEYRITRIEGTRLCVLAH